ncbi:MAG: N-acetyl-gamma-glutamyl-phosphate reductase [Leptospiraceae bacterium]|nr:N-acetyl-gamma-glutamyl-phosphate reductase [Leptospiraceae bacterium]MCP5511549.1 N-acetyl-gamma-glutamyl-phosphate reductase [Leptospiraceae bacterium]
MKVSILGAGGLTGRELISYLKNHPNFELVHITSNKTKGKALSEVFPELGWDDSRLKFSDHSDPIPTGSLVVLAVPNEVALETAPVLLEKGHKVIDISGAFRLHNKEEFEFHYGIKHTAFEYMDRVQFGSPELFREKLKKADFVSNPGCYSSSVFLPLYFLGDLRKEIQSPVVVSAASGVSGAGGRTEEIGFTFTNTYENFRAYKVLSHQHTPEMIEYGFWNSPLHDLVFTPHLLPVYRGILSTIFVNFQREVPVSELENVFQKTSSEPFIRKKPKPEDIELKYVQNSNYLDFSYRIKGKQMILTSSLDNLGKGAAGGALQNMNLMCGFKETEGLLRL